MKVEMLSAGSDNLHGFQLIPETHFEAHWLQKFVKQRGNIDGVSSDSAGKFHQGIWFPEERDIKDLNTFRVSIS